MKLEERGLHALDVKPFPWTGPVGSAEKSILNTSPLHHTHFRFEQKFCLFLDRAPDVVAYIKNETRTINLKIPYIAKDGFLRRYIPDFIVKTRDFMVIVETKGREDVDVKAKDLQGKKWTEEITKRTGIKWIFIRIDQKEFEKIRYKNFYDLID